MTAKQDKISEVEPTHSPLIHAHSTSSLSSLIASNQSKRFHPYPIQQRALSQPPLKSPSRFSHCSLPMEACQEQPDICIGDCPPEIDCEGPYIPCPDQICTSSNCYNLHGKDFCSGPCDSAPCDSSCDWMDWLQCDGSNCSRHHPDADCCCIHDQIRDGSTEATLFLSQHDIRTQAPYSLNPFTSLNSITSLPQTAPTLSRLRYPNRQQSQLQTLDLVGTQPTGSSTNPGIYTSSTLSQLQSSGSSIPPTLNPIPQSSSQEPFVHERAVCLWGACRQTFETHSELVAHVNHSHLEIPSAIQDSSQSNLFCRWADCPQQPPGEPSSVPRELDFTSLNELAQHLLKDHLGLSVDGGVDPLLAALTQSSSSILIQEIPETAALVPHVSLGYNPDFSQSVKVDIPASTASPSSSSSPSSPPTLSPLRQFHTPPPLTKGSNRSSNTSADPDVLTPAVCLWAGCSESFPSLEALSAHVEEHVGSGKGEYHCRWHDCDRHGEKAFSSKQKILRHLQSHTGHRPFLCDLCGQHFSEAATLQQHMRRHTSEKPYACDHLGCGKSFAVAGALTIHKRTHSGQKPFKCTFCDRAFSESSNLSKHLRTHTGEKPYPCLEPGCGKKFCRPDQLNRHKSVHSKKIPRGFTADSAQELTRPSTSMEVESLNFLDDTKESSTVSNISNSGVDVDEAMC